MKFCPIIALLATLFVQKATAQFASERAGLLRVHVVEKTRIFYSLEGAHAVDPTDANGNQIPDQVEDIGTQVRAAWMLLVTGLGFPDPFEGERYKGVPYLDIHLFSKDYLKSNGVAYDEIQKFNRPGDAEGTGSLCFDVATSVKAPENLTPIHELFHVIQNGATYFKNRWFTEGTARWSEHALGEGGIGKGLRTPWTISRGWDKLEEMSYDAAALYWEPLTLKLDPKGKIPQDLLPAELIEMRYINGDPVMKDLELHGWEFIREFILELGRMDDAAYGERKLTRWSEEEQRSPANSVYIRRAVETVQGRLTISNRRREAQEKLREESKRPER